MSHANPFPVIIFCPLCQSDETVDPLGLCLTCGADLGSLQEILFSAQDSLRLALEALRERRDQEALDYAYEAWGLKQTMETAAVGLLAAMQLRDGQEAFRWLKRRRRMSSP